MNQLARSLAWPGLSTFQVPDVAGVAAGTVAPLAVSSSTGWPPADSLTARPAPAVWVTQGAGADGDDAVSVIARRRQQTSGEVEPRFRPAGHHGHAAAAQPGITRSDPDLPAMRAHQDRVLVQHEAHDTSPSS